MTKVQLTSKVYRLIRDDKELIKELINKAVSNGSMDIEGAKNDFILPKNLICAIYKEMSRQYAPMDKSKDQLKNVENIYIQL